MSLHTLVAGSQGMVGAAVCRALETVGESYSGKHRGHLDFRNRDQVDTLFREEKFSAVVICAAKVGGIHANSTYPAEFIFDNILIAANLIDAAHHNNIQRLVFLGSSCIYPRLATQPMREDALLGGPLEFTNEAYAVAKIAGLKMCESYNVQYGRDYRTLMPTNLYGPGDNFHSEDSHVIPGLMQRFHAAKESRMSQVKVWGSGMAQREFLHVDDLAHAVVRVLTVDSELFSRHVPIRNAHINVGTGRDISIRDLASTIKDIVQLDAKLVFDSSKPDGTPRKLLDTSRIRSLGWSPSIELQQGLTDTYAWFLAQENLRR